VYFFVSKMENDLGRFGIELYQWDPKESDPRNPKWLEKEDPELLVGRGTGTTWWSKADSHAYLPIDAFGGVFKTNDNHIWMDFNVSSFYLPSNWAMSITFDYSTWRYMKPMLYLKEWCRILQKGSCIYFEDGISSFKLGHANSFEHDNPSHIILTKESFLKCMAGVGQLELAEQFLLGYRTPRTIVIPAHDKPMQSMEKKVGQILRHATTEMLFKTYCSLFEPMGLQIRKCALELQTSHPVLSWIELRKL
jgi:hypothetical protein